MATNTTTMTWAAAAAAAAPAQGGQILNAGAKHRALVVDTNAIVRGVRMERMARELYTVPEVLAEVRDRQTRSGVLAVAVLPSIKLREPTPDAIHRIIEMSKKTGDFPALSAVDIRVCALTLTLNDEAHAQDNPQDDQKKADGKDEPTEEEEEEDEGEEEETAEEPEEDEGEGAEEEEPETRDDDDGWITPENLAEMTAKVGHHSAIVDEGVDVGCLTADFAMQNVLIQTGLCVVSFEGMRITAARTWALKCFSCEMLVRNTTKVFCPRCGNSTLRKVEVETSEDGGLREAAGWHPKPISRRGTKHPLPKPRGGRNNHDPITTEDALMHKLRTMPRPRADDDAGSRATRGLTVQQQRKLVGAAGFNPNVSRKRYGKKNKSKTVSFT